jgi:hypothetical protein
MNDLNGDPANRDPQAECWARQGGHEEVTDLHRKKQWSVLLLIPPVACTAELNIPYVTWRRARIQIRCVQSGSRLKQE